MDNTKGKEPVLSSVVDVSPKQLEMHLDDVLELIPCGKFHYRLLIICGMSFMADAMVSFEINLLFVLTFIYQEPF